MKKSIFGICAVALIGISILLFALFSTNITADIPSASSYVPTYKDWNVQFSEQMNPKTFTEDTVTVLDYDDKKVAVNREWNADHTVLTLHSPEDGYQMDGNYQLSISKNVETAQGMNLSASLTHSFQAVDELPNIKDKEQLAALLNERAEKMRELHQGTSVEESAEASGESASSADSAANDAGTSETNVQVDGIGEGDILKSDGDYIYFVRENDIVIASAEGTDSNVVSTIQEESFRARELFLHNNLLISIGRSQKPLRTQEGTREQGDSAIYPVHSMQTTAYIYDISDKASPEKMREFTMEGNLLGSRKMDDFLYLVGNHHPPMHIFRENGEKEVAEDIELRPFVKDTASSEEGEPINFANSYFFPESNDIRFMLLASINLNEMEQEAKIESYLGASEKMYMSKNHIYTAVNRYSLDNTPGSKATEGMITQSADTEIIQFGLQKGSISYNASTVVNGTLINQFAMDERNETFRVATTKGDMWQNDKPSTNNLYVLDTDLNPLGKVEGLAEGERIYSVRFMENTAYMVTFKQIDPLFVIDLKNPDNPTVLGELKIPGFSNYLHPLDDHHLIGFGQHTELEEVNGSSEPRVRQAGLKISVFDVSDPVNPEEKFSEILGQEGSHSQINYNHRSLYKHPEKNLFGFPASLSETKTVHKGDATYQEHSFVYEGAFLYDISPDAGINLKDTITHQDKNVEYPKWEKQIQRMVSVDNLLYTLSFDEMKIYNMDEEQVMGSVEFPARNPQH